MDTDHTAGTPPETDRGSDPWILFETRLAAYLSTMIDPSDEDRLVLFVPRPDADEAYAQIVVSPLERGTVLRVEYPWDMTAAPQTALADFAWRMCETIRFRYELPHPELLSVRASGPAAGGVGILGLADHTQVPGDSDATPARLVYAASRDELRNAALAVVTARHPDVRVDDDGDVCLSVDGAWAWVIVSPDEPTVELRAMSVGNVRSRRQTDTELNVVNRTYRWSRWLRHDRWVRQTLLIPSRPFNPVMFDEMLDIFIANYREVTEDLADRLGGEAAPCPPA